MSIDTFDGDDDEPRTQDGMVYLAMTLVAGAVASASYFEFAVSAWLSALIGLAALSVSLALHRMVKAWGTSPDHEDMDELEAEIAKLNSRTRMEDAGRPAKARPAAPQRKQAPRAIPVANAPALASMTSDRRRPAGANGTAAPALRLGPQPSLSAEGPPPALSERMPRQADVEVVQGLVRKLADKVTAAEAAASEPPRMEGAIEASLEALRATAQTMRAAELGAEPALGSVGLDSGLPPQTPAPQQDNHEAAVAEALSAGRCEVLLEPILHLEDRRVRHYAVAMNLKAPNGATIPCRPGEDARDEAFGPALDGLRLARTAQLARRLAERGKPGFVFFDLTAAALGSERFLAEFASLYHEPDAWVRQLVPNFAQDEVEKFTNREWDALRDFGKAGLCFSIREVEHLDMNLVALKPWGFEFAQIDAEAYLAGLPQGGKAMAPAEATRRLAAGGFTPIVRGIDDDAKASQLAMAGAFLGFGPLFGAPRPVKADVLQHAPGAVAA